MSEVPSLTPRHAVPAEGGGEPEHIDRYELLEVLGRGAMGIVYRAWDPVVQRSVAIKRLVVPADASPEQARELRSRFAREAHAASRLSHPNVVAAYDHGEGYLTMELVEGAPLDTLLRGRVEPRLALAILEQVAAALDHAHAAGVIHRDVKPANVLVTRAGVAKVADFGLAKLENDLAAALSWDAPAGDGQGGGIIGTPACMAPEQVLGREVTPAADRFALAVMAYVLLTGRRPFQAETLNGILHRIVNEPPPPVAASRAPLPAALDDVFSRGLAKRPEERHATARELVEELRTALEAPPAPAGPEPAGTGGEEEDDGWLLPALSILALLLGLGAALSFVLGLEVPAMPAPRLERAASPSAAPSVVGEPPGATRAARGAPSPARAVAPRPEQAPARVPPRIVTAPRDEQPRAEESSRSDVPAPLPAAGRDAARAKGSSGPAASPDPAAQSWGLAFFPEPAPLTGGAQVRSVVEGSAAWEAGLRAKDVVVRWQGVQVYGPSDVARLQAPAGATEIAVDYLRDVRSTLQRSQTAIRIAPPATADDDAGWTPPVLGS